MTCSVIVRTKDEADRLRLTLTSLRCQSQSAQVVVVNDGSSDHTSQVLSEFSGVMPLLSITHQESKGRSAASNAGAQVSDGDLLIFLDGDTLAGPDFVARHDAAHLAKPKLIGRGETFHLRSTRFLQDPETALPRYGEERRLESMPTAEREGLKITREEIQTDFASIHRRATPGVYPGAGPRALYEIEISALKNNPDCFVLWAAASGANFSVSRAAFMASGGFDNDMVINEHRELALRLCNDGGQMGFVEGAHSYHMTHRSGWRDPLQETSWELVFYRRHPVLAVKLLSVLWASLSSNCPIPPHLRMLSLTELENATRGDSNIDCDAIRSLIPGLVRLDETSV